MFSMLTACPGARQLHSMEPSVPRTAQTAHWELHSTHGCKGSKNPSEKKPKSQGKRIMVGNNVKKSPDVRGTLELELWKGKALEWTEFMSLGMRAETSATAANCPLGWQELVTDPITLISIPHTKPLTCTWVHQPWISELLQGNWSFTGFLAQGITWFEKQSKLGPTALCVCSYAWEQERDTEGDKELTQTLYGQCGLAGGVQNTRREGKWFHLFLSFFHSISQIVQSDS